MDESNDMSTAEREHAAAFLEEHAALTERMIGSDRGGTYSEATTMLEVWAMRFAAQILLRPTMPKEKP